MINASAIAGHLAIRRLVKFACISLVTRVSMLLLNHGMLFLHCTVKKE